MTSARSRSVGIAAVGVALVTAYAIVMVLQILVWNPSAAAPAGLTLVEIYATMRAQDERFIGAELWEISVAGLGVLLAVAFFVAVLIHRPSRPLTVVACFSALLALGGPAYFLASFSMGMSLADTFAIGGGDVAPWAGLLYAVSGLAAITAFVSFVTLGARRSERLTPPTPP